MMIRSHIVFVILFAMLQVVENKKALQWKLAGFIIKNINH